MNFGFSSSLQTIKDTVARWAADKLQPQAQIIDETNEFPRYLWPELGGLGLLGITPDEEFGGSGFGYLAHCVVMEEISRASASVLACLMKTILIYA